MFQYFFHLIVSTEDIQNVSIFFHLIVSADSSHVSIFLIPLNCVSRQ